MPNEPEELTPMPPSPALPTWIWGYERPWPTGQRTVWGLPILYRILSTAEEIAVDLAADLHPAPAAVAEERAIQTLARAIVAIDGQTYVGTFPAGDTEEAVAQVLQRRVQHLRDLPMVLVSATYDAYGEVRTACAEAVDGAQGAAGGAT